MPIADLGKVVAAIAAKRRQVPAQHSLLVGISGIDGSGKGYVTGGIVAELQGRAFRAVGINVDGWLNLPAMRFSRNDPAGHFYEHALRFDEMFAQLVLPLKATRRIELVMDFAEETATAYRKQSYHFEDVDIIVLEGIYLLKRSHRHHLDLAVWVDCTFETALERALQRGQEGLPPEETIRAYETIYFPAQRIHFERDDPRAAADLILRNDPRSGAPGPSPSSLGVPV